MLCSLPKLSRQGFASPPFLHKPWAAHLLPRAHKRGKEPGWRKAAGHSLPLVELSQAGRVLERAPQPEPFLSLSGLLHGTSPAGAFPAQHTSGLHRALPWPRQTPHQTRQPYRLQKPAPNSLPLP